MQWVASSRSLKVSCTFENATFVDGFEISHNVNICQVVELHNVHMFDWR